MKTDVVAHVAAGQAGDAADGVKRPVDDGRGADGEQESCVHATVLCARTGGGESARRPLKARGAAGFFFRPLVGIFVLFRF